MSKVSPLPTLDTIQVQGKTVLVRVDLNIPMHDGKILDYARVERIIPTLRELLHHQAKVVVLSHFGRPKGQIVPSMSLKPLAEVLSKLLNHEVVFASDCISPQTHRLIASLKNGDIAMLENLRFKSGEEDNDPDFAKGLSQLGDLYVNDSFSVSHRAHASVDAITHYLPSYAGRLMEEELQALERTLGNPQRPMAAFVAGSKISTKLFLLKNLISKVDYLILGGGIANTFLLARGISVGSSLVEESMVAAAQDIEEAARAHNCTLVLPQDVMVAMEHGTSLSHQVTGLDDIGSHQKIYDIGPETQKYLKDLLQHVKTVVWNGPLGVFEKSPFDTGTNEVAMAAASLTQQGKLFTIAGGGETVAALNASGAGQNFSYLSTAGGAFLEWLEGKTLPGVKALLEATQVNKEADSKRIAQA